MKNLPDKIYVHEISAMELDVKIPYSVEYVREDALIKKMQDWVKNRAESFIVDTHLFPYFDYKRAIEDLKEYIG